MTAVRFVLGAEADLASKGEVREAVDEGLGSFFRGNPRPLFTPRIASEVIDVGTGNHIFQLGNPPGGKMWKVQRAGITVINQTTGDYVALAATQPAMLFTGNVPRAGDALPSIGFVGQFVNSVIDFDTPYPLFSKDTLYVVLNVTVAFAAAVRVGVTVMVAELPDTAVVGGVA